MAIEIIKYIQIAIIIITCIIVAVKFSTILKWIKPTFEDNQGYASYKRLTAFALLAADFYLLFNDKITTTIMLHVHYSLLTAMLLTAAIITTENIITVLKIVKGKNQEKEEQG